MLDDLAKLMRCAVKNDTGTPAILGKREQYIENSIHAEGTGVLIMASFKGARKWNLVKKELLEFCSLRQCGDREGVFYMAVLPTKAQAALLRRRLGVRKRPDLTDEQKIAARDRLLKGKAAAERPPLFP